MDHLFQDIFCPCTRPRKAVGQFTGDKCLAGELGIFRLSAPKPIDDIPIRNVSALVAKGLARAERPEIPHRPTMCTAVNETSHARLVHPDRHRMVGPIHDPRCHAEIAGRVLRLRQRGQCPPHEGRKRKQTARTKTGHRYIELRHRRFHALSVQLHQENGFCRCIENDRKTCADQPGIKASAPIAGVCDGFKFQAIMPIETCSFQSVPWILGVDSDGHRRWKQTRCIVSALVDSSIGDWVRCNRRLAQHRNR